MRFLHIIHEVYGRPWLILPSYHANIRRVIHARLLNPEAKKREGTDISGEAVELPQMLIEDGIAQIPVAGVLLKGASAWEKGAGAVAVEDVTADIEEALLDDKVGGIFFDIDSPGGTVRGIPELAATVKRAASQKHVRAFSDGTMASAAYWMGSGAGDVIAGRSADVGSIGVYLPWIDQSEAFAMEGLSVEIIRNEGADLKGLGYPGTSLTESQRQSLIDEVQEIAEMFHADVLAARQINQPADTFRGQTFMGESAKDRGLIDDVMDRESALSDFHDLVHR